MEQLWDEVKNYIDLRMKSFKLQMTEHLALGTGRLLAFITFIIFIGFAILLLSLGLTIVVAEWINSYAWAFVIVGGLYALLAVTCFVLRDSIFSSAMVRTFSKMFFPPEAKDEEEEDDED